METKHSDIVAFGMTTAIVAFVGALVVLTIPFAVLSTPLPPAVNRLGLSIEATQSLLFERGWYLLIPSFLFALWAGYKSYQWGRKSASAATPDETAAGDG